MLHLKNLVVEFHNVTESRTSYTTSVHNACYLRLKACSSAAHSLWSRLTLWVLWSLREGIKIKFGPFLFPNHSNPRPGWCPRCRCLPGQNYPDPDHPGPTGRKPLHQRTLNRYVKVRGVTLRTINGLVCLFCGSWFDTFFITFEKCKHLTVVMLIEISEMTRVLAWQHNRKQSNAQVNATF